MNEDDESDIRRHTKALAGDPLACAGHLNSALKTGRAVEIAVALFDVQSAAGGDVKKFDFGYDLRLVHIMDVLHNAGLRLVAVEAPSAEPGEAHSNHMSHLAENGRKLKPN